MEKYSILKIYEKGGSNLGIYLLYNNAGGKSYIGKHGTSSAQVEATKRLYAQSPECAIRFIETFIYEGYIMMVTEYMTASVGDYVRNVDAFSDTEFKIIITNVYQCWKKLALQFRYVGDDFKLDNIVYDEKTLATKFIDVDQTSFKKQTDERDMVESAIGFGIVELPLSRTFRENPEYTQRVARIILGVIEERYRSDALLANLGLKLSNIGCNAVEGCTRRAEYMCGNTYKIFYCRDHKSK